MEPIYIHLEVALVETTAPSNDLPDNSPKLMVQVNCGGKLEYTSALLPKQTSECSTQEVVKLLFERVGEMVGSRLDMLNELPKKMLSSDGSAWIDIPIPSTP